MEPGQLPSTTTERPRTYLISGSLGIVLFTVSGLLWDEHPFAGSLFLELGGGAFIVFLLEFILPSFLGYADSMLRVLRVTRLVWRDSAVEALVTDYVDDVEYQRLVEAVERGPYPARKSWWRRITDTGALEEDQHPVLAKTVPVGPTTMRYYVKDRTVRSRTVVVVGLERQPPSPGRGQ
jgi:hypothetical protein